MKKILLITFLLIPFIGFSQTTKPIDGFLGIKFGSSKLAVIAAMKAKGAKLGKGDPADILSFSNVHLGQREAEVFFIRFINNKAFDAEFTFKPQDDYHAIEYYDSLVKDISEIYGKGDATRKFTSSFVEGDGHEVGALLIGAADLHTIWESSNKNAINAVVAKDDEGTSLEITLVYQDDALTDLALSKEKAKDKGDF